VADIVKVNEAELLFLSGTGDPAEGCRKVAEKGPRLCVATLGPNGSAWGTRTGSGVAPGFTVQAVDATGCGDAFMAALLVKLLPNRGALASGMDAEAMERNLRWANAAGALTALKKGVMSALPTAREVEELAGHP